MSQLCHAKQAPPQISPELAQLWMHAISEYEDIRDLEAKLEKARRRHADLHAEIQAMCTQGSQS